MYIGDVKITLREILFSIILILVMLTMGFFINTAISNAIAEKNEIYYKALKIDSNAEQFSYGMKTNVGNSLVYGNFKCIDTVTIPELKNQYWAISKITEKYTEHTQVVTYTDSEGETYTQIETYYTWDMIDSISKSATKFTFLDNEFLVSKINLPAYTLNLSRDIVSDKYQSWAYGNYIYKDGDFFASTGDIRYSFYYTPLQFTGTVVVNLKNNSMFDIDNDKAKIGIFVNTKISETIEKIESSGSVLIVFFWVLWTILTMGLVCSFCYIQNDWLEDQKKG